jgi:hypothetical protein
MGTRRSEQAQADSLPRGGACTRFLSPPPCRHGRGGMYPLGLGPTARYLFSLCALLRVLQDATTSIIQSRCSHVLVVDGASVGRRRKGLVRTPGVDQPMPSHGR